MSAGMGDALRERPARAATDASGLGGSPLGWLLLAAAALAAAGIGIASYLTVVHFAHQPIACSSIGDCELVNSSKYAELAGIPVATMGAVAYVLMLLMVAGAALRRSSMLVFVAWTVALASFGFSMYLTYIELRVLDAICVYCVGSASVATALFVALSGALWLVRDDLLGDVPDSDRGA